MRAASLENHVPNIMLPTEMSLLRYLCDRRGVVLREYVWTSAVQGGRGLAENYRLIPAAIQQPDGMAPRDWAMLSSRVFGDVVFPSRGRTAASDSESDIDVHVIVNCCMSSVLLTPADDGRRQRPPCSARIQ